METAEILLHIKEHKNTGEPTLLGYMEISGGFVYRVVIRTTGVGEDAWLVFEQPGAIDSLGARQWHKVVNDYNLELVFLRLLAGITEPDSGFATLLTEEPAETNNQQRE